MRGHFRTGRFRVRRITLVIVALALFCGLGVAVVVYRGVSAEAPLLPKIVTGGAPVTVGQLERIGGWEISVIDGDTILARGRTIRLVGFDAPETGNQARCAREREIATRATAQLRALVNGGGLQLRLVRCACPPGTEGTSACNYGRACGELRAHGRDVGAIMITYLLAHPYVCSANSCPPRKSWC